MSQSARSGLWAMAMAARTAAVVWLLVISPASAQIAQPTGPAVTATGSAATGQIPGTATNDNACATCVGANVSSAISSGGAVSITPSGTIVNVTSISLTAGDWIVYGIVTFNGGSTTTVSSLSAGVNTTSITLPGSAAYTFWGLPAAGATAFVNNPLSFTTFPTHVSTSGTQTVYLLAQCTFGVSTCSAWGSISAFRIR